MTMHLFAKIINFLCVCVNNYERTRNGKLRTKKCLPD